jgi:two-component sensor histidine kinase
MICFHAFAWRLLRSRRATKAEQTDESHLQPKRTDPKKQEIVVRKIVGPDRSRPEPHLFLRELTHRVNNEFAAAIGMVSTFASRSPDPKVKALLCAVADRLNGYAQVHRSLTMPAHDDLIDAAAYLKRLCHSISQSKLDFKCIELELVERPFLMGSDRCWRLGMMISEIITNAARHAFDERGGKIRVELQPRRSFVRCIVADNGRGAAEYQAGHGSSIIQAVVDSLEGTLDQHVGPCGVVTVLTFPAEPASPSANSVPHAGSPISMTGGPSQSC